jgi:hypothetical protein
MAPHIQVLLLTLFNMFPKLVRNRSTCSWRSLLGGHRRGKKTCVGILWLQGWH